MQIGVSTAHWVDLFEGWVISYCFSFHISSATWTICAISRNNQGENQKARQASYAQIGIGEKRQSVRSIPACFGGAFGRPQALQSLCDPSGSLWVRSGNKKIVWHLKPTVGSVGHVAEIRVSYPTKVVNICSAKAFECAVLEKVVENPINPTWLHTKFVTMVLVDCSISQVPSITRTIEWLQDL